LRRLAVPVPQRVSVLSLSCILVLSGCSASYNSERLFWKASQLNVPILKDPQAASPTQFVEAINAFQRVIDETPGTIWAARSNVAIGSLYALQQRYDEARIAYGLVLQNYHRYSDLALGARYALAKTYEAQRNWEPAVKAYRDLSDYHPWSVAGLEAPLYIARVYGERQETAAEAKAYERAASHYTKLIPNAPNPELEVQVRGYLALVYQRQGDWDRAIDALQKMLLSTVSVNRPMVLLTLGSIYQAKLSDTEKATAAFTALAEEFPDHPFGKVAKAQLDHLGGAPPVPVELPVAAPQSSLTDPAFLSTLPTPSAIAP